MRTFSGSEVIIPNGELISNRLINWTMSDRRRRYDIAVGVAYDSDQKRVHVISALGVGIGSRGIFDPPMKSLTHELLRRRGHRPCLRRRCNLV